MNGINSFLENVKEKLTAYYGDEYEVNICSVTKNNDHIRNGLTIRKRGENLAPTIYLDEIYEEYLDGCSLENITSKVIGLRAQCKDSIDVDVDFFTDYESVRDKLGIRLVSRERNRNLLMDVPHIDFADMSIIFNVKFAHDDIGNGSILIRNEHLSMWNISLDRLYEDAKSAAVYREPPYLNDLINVMNDIFDKKGAHTWKDMRTDIKQQMETMRDKRHNLFILTNQSKVDGAAVIAYPGMLQQLGEYLEDDYFIIPSSIHEVLIVPMYAYDGDGKGLSLMVKEVNLTELDPEEVLSEHAYRYHRDTHWLEPVDVNIDNAGA